MLACVMPLEDRRIIFNADELYHAIYAHCKRAEMRAPPPGKIDSVKFKGELKDAVSILVTGTIEEDTRTLEYSRAFIAAALIMYCRGTGIPVPKAADKSIDVVKDQVILRAVM